MQMLGPSLTLGRGNENDVVLPDPDRTLSKRHCAIENHNGNIIVVDLSTNGTFLNYGKLPLGNVSTPLNDGDILSLGPYEIMVSIDTGAPAERGPAAPLEEGPVSHGTASNAPSPADLLDAPGDGGDFLDDLLGGPSQPVGPAGVDRSESDSDGLLPPLGDDPLLPPAPDPYAGQGGSYSSHNPARQDAFASPKVTGSGGGIIPDDWDDDFLKPTGGASDPFAKPADSGGAGAPAFIPDDFGTAGDSGQSGTPPEPETAASDPGPVPERVTSNISGHDAAARAFLKSLGAEGVSLDDADLVANMSRLGHVLRIMIEGMREILMTRTSIKSEFRIEQTMIQSGGNNPLKFSISPEQAVEAMVRPSAKGYLDATEAASQALQDIKAHEIAMITGMEAALKGILKRLDPAVLEEKIQVSGGLGSVLKSKKARYWEIYESMYAEISDQAENDFHELFAREFAKAYQQQLDKLK